MVRPIFALLVILLSFAAQADEVGVQVLAEMNFARAQPQEYARLVEAQADRYRGADGASSVREAAAFLRRTRALPPLAWSDGISQAALNHARDVGSRGGRGHSGSTGSTPWRRMTQYGQWSGYAGENIDYGHSEARAIVVSLIVDHGVRSRAHRANVFSRNFRVAGVAVAPHAAWGTMCVMDFASDFVEAGAVGAPGERRLADRMGAGLRSKYMGKSFY